MKIRFITGVLLMISFFNMRGQERFSADLNFKTEPTDQINFNETNIGLSFNSEINSKYEITNKLQYSNLNVNYELGNFEAFENLNQFGQLKYELGVSHKMTNTTKLRLSIIPTANFQQNIDFSDLSLLGSFEVNQQLNSNTSINIGVARSTVFGNSKFVPTLSLNYKVNDASTLLIGFPDSKISYSNNIRNKFSLTNSFNGNFYNLDHQVNLSNNATKVSSSQMTSAFEYERNVDKNWFINFKAGYDFNKKYTLSDSSNHEIYDFNIGNGYVLGIGIKYKQ